MIGQVGVQSKSMQLPFFSCISVLDVGLVGFASY